MSKRSDAVRSVSDEVDLSIGSVIEIAAVLPRLDDGCADLLGARGPSIEQSPRDRTFLCRSCMGHLTLSAHCLLGSSSDMHDINNLLADMRGEGRCRLHLMEVTIPGSPHHDINDLIQGAEPVQMLESGQLYTSCLESEEDGFEAGSCGQEKIRHHSKYSTVPYDIRFVPPQPHQVIVSH